jgi:ribosomal protein S18 acetylase RimI-like enzyme
MLSGRHLSPTHHAIKEMHTMSVTIVPVRNRKQLKQFVRFPWEIYKDSPYWVPPLIKDKLKFLDKKKGVFFEFGEADYFLAYKDGKLAGRIDAHIDHQYEKHHDGDTGFFGFFECVNDQEVADVLFKAAEGWLLEKGKSKILGPECFTIYDETAFLYEGYDSTPTILLPYNPSYYHDLAKGYGFKKAIDWYAFIAPNEVQPVPAMYRVRERVVKKEHITIEPLNMKEFDSRFEEVKSIFGDAWRENWGHTPLTDSQYEMFASELKLVLVPELTLLAFVNGKMVGFIVTIIDANEAIKKANGRLFPFGIFKLLFGVKKCKRLRIFMMGILKEYRNRGLDAVLYLDTLDKGREAGYKEADCSLIVENNERMIRAIEAFGAKRYKTYRLYEKPITKR